MLPLILLALGLGVALSVYEVSPRARARVNDYVRAIQAAHEAHRAADAHLANAHVATSVATRHAQSTSGALPGMSPPSSPNGGEAHAGASQVVAEAAVDHAIAASVANQEAAQSTAEAAKISKTAPERQAAADSAARVLERGKRIEGALARLGVGQCGVRSYPHVTLQTRDALLAKLHAEGMTVTGDNPWDIDTQLADVKLRAVWDSRAQVLKLIVTSSAFYATCGMIWERIDPILRGIVGETGSV